LKQKIPAPDKEISRKAWLQYFAQLRAVKTPDEALELYQAIKYLPGSSTKAHIANNNQLSVNGPWNMLLYGEVILSAVDDAGTPKLVKLLKRGEDQRVVEFLGAAFLSNPDNNLVASEVQKIILPKGALDNAERAILRGALRVEQAIAAIHSRGMVHMDVKPHNIFVNMNGDWYLGDYGSCVMIGGEIVSYTNGYVIPEIAAQTATTAKRGYDWFALIITLIEVLKKGDIIRDGYANVITSLVQVRFQEIKSNELRGFLEKLAKRTGEDAEGNKPLLAMKEE